MSRTSAVSPTNMWPGDSRSLTRLVQHECPSGTTSRGAGDLIQDRLRTILEMDRSTSTTIGSRFTLPTFLTVAIKGSSTCQNIWSELGRFDSAASGSASGVSRWTSFWSNHIRARHDR